VRKSAIMLQKLTALVCFIFIFSLSSAAQLKTLFASIRPQLEQVIRDFPNHFSGIRGASVTDNEQSAEFESKIVVKDAIVTKLISFSNQKYKSWVWECKLFETDDLEKVKRQYKSYYNDIAGKSLITKPDASNLIAVTDYITPSGELRLCSNQFRMKGFDDVYKHLVVDLVAEYINFQWAVYVRVYDKEKDEEIRPTEKHSSY
jgi:hypothetical protein